MAHDFTGTTNYAQKTPAVTGVPVSMFCHFYSDSLAATKPIIGLWTGAGSVDFIYMYTKSDSKFEVAIRGSTGPDTQAATSTNTVSTGTWYRALAVVTSSAQTVYIDGTKTAGGGVVTVPPAALDTLALARDNFTRYLDGRIAEAAVWSAALTDAEYASLNAGYSPMLIRPTSLVHYAPLLRGMTDRRGAAFSETGSGSVIEHPRVIYPRRKQTYATSVIGLLRENAGLGAMGGGPFARSNAGLGVLA